MAGILTFAALEMSRFRSLNSFLTYIQMFTILVAHCAVQETRGAAP